MYQCQSCEAEFELIFGGKDQVEFCPFCGDSELELIEFEDEDD
jgi:rRNA maturation endonuclease Nob1